MAKSSPESNSDFQSVSTIGAGYLAVTWLFMRLMLMQSDRIRAYVLGMFGLLLQFVFASVFRAQQDARSKQLNIRESKWPIRKDYGDVILRMLNGLFVVFFACFLVFVLVALITSFPNVKLRPFTL